MRNDWFLPVKSGSVPVVLPVLRDQCAADFVAATSGVEAQQQRLVRLRELYSGTSPPPVSPLQHPQVWNLQLLLQSCILCLAKIHSALLVFGKT